jgi:hypothetical protein
MKDKDKQRARAREALRRIKQVHQMLSEAGLVASVYRGVIFIHSVDSEECLGSHRLSLFESRS